MEKIWPDVDKFRHVMKNATVTHSTTARAGSVIYPRTVYNFVVEKYMYCGRGRGSAVG